MSESKTYIFGENQNGGSNGMLGLLAPLLQKQGVDPNVLLAMKGNNGFGGEGGWFMWVIFLFFLMGWGISKLEGKVSGMEGKLDKMMGLLQQAINK